MRCIAKKNARFLCIFYKGQPNEERCMNDGNECGTETKYLERRLRPGFLPKLYGADTATVAAQRVRYVDMIDHFEENFGTGRTVCLYSAPGRTEIGGNHTDHNNGVVIAAAVNLDIIAVVAKNDENVVRVISHGFGKIRRCESARPDPAAR